MEASFSYRPQLIWESGRDFVLILNGCFIASLVDAAVPDTSDVSKWWYQRLIADYQLLYEAAYRRDGFVGLAIFGARDHRNIWERGYTGTERTVLYCGITRSEVTRLKTLVSEVDPKAFMVIGQAHEALGEGFHPL